MYVYHQPFEGQLGLFIPRVCEHVSVYRSVHVGVDVCLCLSVSHPGSLTFLFFPPHPHCVRLNASVACLPARTYADLLYKTFQLKIVAPSINLAPLWMCFSSVPIPAEKMKNGFYACFAEGGSESYPPAISVIPFHNGVYLYIC